MIRARAGLALALLFAVACSGDVLPSSGTAQPTSSPSPRAPRETVFAVKGDWGAGTSAQAAVTQQMCRVRLLIPFQVVVTTGDNFYEPDGVAVERTYERPERCLIRGAGVTWRASWGNHDAAGNDTGEALGARDRTYAFRVGSVGVLVLDSNRVEDPAQTAEAEAWLRATTAPVRIVVFHHPPFTAGSLHPPDERVQARWVPLFERYDVTLVLNGHQHLYEHHRVAGIDYVVTGGGGAGLYACARTPPTLLRCEEHHHFLLVRVRERRVAVEAIAPNGDVIDRFTIAA